VHAFLILATSGSPGEGGSAGGYSDELGQALNQLCRQRIGAHARIDRFCVIPGLPKTRSGKVMRRILRKVAEGDPSNLGDISTLAEPAVVEAIVNAEIHG